MLVAGTNAGTLRVFPCDWQEEAEAIEAKKRAEKEAAEAVAAEAAAKKADEEAEVAKAAAAAAEGKAKVCIVAYCMFLQGFPRSSLDSATLVHV